MTISIKKSGRDLKVTYFENNRLPSDFNVEVEGFDVELTSGKNSLSCII
jgi:hypothetical protein